MFNIGSYRFLTLFIWAIISISPSHASLRFEHFSNKEGFNQNTISAIEQDKYGNLWFGTPNGLIQYDGYEFINYSTNRKDVNWITDNHIECLLKCKEGNLWIGHWKGVDIYLPEDEKFISVPFKAEFIANEIKADSKGNVWISGRNELYKCKLIRTATGFEFDISENMAKLEPSLSNINTFCFIDENNVLISKGNGLAHLEIQENDARSDYDSISIQHYTSFSDVAVTSIKKIDNTFWIGTNIGLYRTFLDGEQLRIIEKFKLKSSDKRDVSDVSVIAIFKDNNGSIWIGSENEGIFKYDIETDSIENFGYDPKSKDGISSSRINCFFQDNFDVLWVGTAQGGINKLDLNQKQFINYSNNPCDDNSLAGNLIMDILEDNLGYLWILSYEGEVCRSIEPVMDENIGNLRFEQLRNRIPIKEKSFFTSIFQDSNNFIWLASEDSPLVVYVPKTDQFKEVQLISDRQPIYISRCRTIGQINSNTLLVGGDKICLVDNPWAEVLNNEKPILNVRPVLDDVALLQTFIKDANNNFWFGTENGLFQSEYKDNSFNLIGSYSTSSNKDFKINHNNVFSLHEDRSGNIWVGTFGGGLNKIGLNESGKPVNITFYTQETLLPDDVVYGILQEDGEHLWISTDNGLCRLNTVKDEVDVFNMSDGLPHNNFRQSAYFKGKLGHFYFGGLNGLTVFKPQNIKINDILPKALITGISINNKPVRIGEALNGDVIVNKSIVETGNIEINHHAKIVTFHLAVQHSVAPSKNRLAYMLEGFNNEWIETDNGKTSVTFTNLPYGNYTLRIKGANGDGLWNNETRDLGIKVIPPWYQTWWSYTIWIIFALIILAGIFVYFILHEKLKQRLKYEQIDKQRIDSINLGRLQFFTNVSHEFRTPLTLIAGPLEKLIEKNRSKENSKYLSTIQSNTKRLMGLVDQLITFRKAEQGHLSLNLSSGTLGNFIYPSTEAFEEYAIQKHVNFFYKINSPNKEVVVDVEKTERIIFNLLSNSFRFTPVNGNISIETDLVEEGEKKMVSIKVIDSGKGIPKEKQDRIFERFYQLEGRKENVGGTGIGLAFCKSLIDLMGGTISVESEQNVRTCFTVLLPSYNVKEIELMGVQRSFIRDWIPAQKTEKEIIADSLSNRSKKYSVLIVEDEAGVRDFLVNELGDNYSITMAENGSEGWNKVRETLPDLVISDVMMPEMDGFELCEKIKSTPETCHLPVILLTALGDNENRIKGFEFRADDYISKPFSPRHLELRIEKLIENNQRLKEHFSKHSYMPDKSIEISVRDRSFLKQIVNAIEKNLSNSNFGVEELAQEIGGQSQSQFYRRFKQLTGQVPNAYLRNFRLERAAELLRSNEGFTVAEVMYEIGIESRSYFSTSFKKQYGVTPSDYIKQFKGK